MALKHWAWLTGLCVALAAPLAYSQQREAGDVYLGAALGYNMAPDAEDEGQKEIDEVYGVGQVPVSVDDGVFGWGAYGGYLFADFLALEFGYLGNADMDVTLGGVNVDWSTSAWYAAAVAYIPMSDGAAAFPFVKGGFARWESEFSVDAGEATISYDEDGTNLLLGAGIEVPVGDKVSIRGEYMLLLLDDDDYGSHHRLQVGVNFAF